MSMAGHRKPGEGAIHGGLDECDRRRADVQHGDVDGVAVAVIAEVFRNTP
jgi:hypothetical protein